MSEGLVAIIGLLGVLAFAAHVWGIAQLYNVTGAKGYPQLRTGVVFLTLFTGVIGYLLVIALPDISCSASEGRMKADELPPL